MKDNENFKIVNPIIKDGVLTYRGTDVRDALHYICNYLHSIFTFCQDHKEDIIKKFNIDPDEIDPDMFLDIEGPACHILDWYEGFEPNLLDGCFNREHADWNEERQQYVVPTCVDIEHVIYSYISNHHYDESYTSEQKEYNNYCLNKIAYSLEKVAKDIKEKTSK